VKGGGGEPATSEGKEKGEKLCSPGEKVKNWEEKKEGFKKEKEEELLLEGHQSVQKKKKKQKTPICRGKRVNFLKLGRGLKKIVQRGGGEDS